MGSAKDLLLGSDTLGGRIYVPPTPHKLGLGAWQVSGASSVADLKGAIPKHKIKHKPEVLGMGAGAYWEDANSHGFANMYVGMLDAGGNITDVATLLQRGELSDTVVMKLAWTPHDVGAELTDDVRREYHRLIRMGEITAFIGDAECIWRGGFPVGSSTFKRIFKAANMLAAYEGLATYDALVVGLDEIRGISGIMDSLEMKRVLTAAGLDRIPNPGHLLETEAIDFTTKFDPSGDVVMTDIEAMAGMHLDTTSFEAWCHTLRRNARHQRDFCRKRGIENFDGKTEMAKWLGKPLFTDFACTPDENRLMLQYTRPDGQICYIPVNKEIMRAVFRVHGIYTAIERSRSKYGALWAGHLSEFVSQQRLAEVLEEAIWMMEQAMATIGNKLLGVDVFDADPIDNWVGPFLPYASLAQAA